MGDSTSTVTPGHSPTPSIKSENDPRSPSLSSREASPTANPETESPRESIKKGKRKKSKDDKKSLLPEKEKSDKSDSSPNR